VILFQHPGNAAIADTVAAVFRTLFHKPPPVSAWDQLLQWLSVQLLRFLELLQHISSLGIAFRIGLWTAVILAVFWVIMLLVLRSQDRVLTTRFRRQRTQDYWQLAQQLAAQEQYTEAAHALYSGLLYAIAQRRYVVVNDTKTIGDYVREVKKRAPSSLVAHFVEFTRSYETIVYRLGICDVTRYTHLYDLATRMTKETATGNTGTKTAA